MPSWRRTKYWYVIMWVSDEAELTYRQMVNIGSTATGAKVVAVKADAARLSLTSPACTEIGEKVALSRRIEKHWRLIGWANIVA